MLVAGFGGQLQQPYQQYPGHQDAYLGLDPNASLD